MEFEKIRIACICESNLVQGLEWALDKDPTRSFDFELIPSSLQDIPSIQNDVDLYFFNLDLGQPLPVESLRAFVPKPGLLIALHPTPHQLLSVFEVMGLSALAWNGQTFEEIAARLSEITQQHILAIRKSRLLDSLVQWNESHRHWPAQIVWMNGTTQQESSFLLNEKSPLSIGGAQSGCDICLEHAGSYKIAEFLFFDGSWHFRLLQKELRASGHYDANHLKAGNFIELDHHLLQVKAHPLMENMTQIFERSRLHLSPPSAESLGLGDENLSLIHLCQRLMLQSRTCELRVQSAGKYGSIFFADGQIEDAIAGSSIGRKALLRILGWEQCRWKLSLNQKKEFVSPNIHLDLTAFSSLVHSWSRQAQALAGQAPPPQIRLTIDAKHFFHRSQWTPEEVTVAAAVCESGRVFEVINNCRLEDHIIYDHLIRLRKQGLINVLG